MDGKSLIVLKPSQKETHEQGKQTHTIMKRKHFQLQPLKTAQHLSFHGLMTFWIQSKARKGEHS
jgi:hypothetical protein